MQNGNRLFVINSRSSQDIYYILSEGLNGEPKMSVDFNKFILTEFGLLHSFQLKGLIVS